MLSKNELLSTSWLVNLADVLKKISRKVSKHFNINEKRKRINEIDYGFPIYSEKINKYISP